MTRPLSVNLNSTEKRNPVPCCSLVIVGSSPWRWRTPATTHGAGARAPGRLRGGAAADAEAEAEVGGRVRALLRHAAAGPLRAAATRAPPHHPRRPPPPGNLDPRLMPRFPLRLPPQPPLRSPRPHHLHRRRRLRPYVNPLPPSKFFILESYLVCCCCVTDSRSFRCPRLFRGL